MPVNCNPRRGGETLASTEKPDAARVVIVGGGIVGCSVAYHLAKLGWKDLVLLEQSRLSGGTTWHAAGMVVRLRTSTSMTLINQYSVELYSRLADETGEPTGWNQVGSIIVGCNEERMAQLERTRAMAEIFGVDASMLDPKEIAARWPAMRTEDLLGKSLPAKSVRSRAGTHPGMRFTFGQAD